ncbi:MAG TPA: hypothetical protein VGI75_01805 [Pirellulales bacterium]|jgi:hypothetical protein
MKRIQKNRSSRIGFETLENRSMLAGNVAAAVSGGLLNISGDGKGDQIVVHQLQTGDWVVAGLNGTKINGQKTATFSEVFSINIKTLGGSDVVGVAGGILPGSLCIDTGAGNDIVGLALLQVGSVNVSTGAGNDALVVAGLKTSTPEVTTTITQSLATSSSGSVNLDAGDGNNIVLLAGITTDNLSLCTGKGIDFIGIAGVCVDECLSVNTGGGTDMLGVIESSAGFAKFYSGNQASDILGTGQNSFGGQTSDFKITLNLNPLVKSLNASFKSVQKSVVSALSGFAGFPTFKI